MNFWRRGSKTFDLERELRSQRPEPRPEFLQQLANDVRAHDPALRRGRVGLALAMTGLMLVAIASFGGAGYASSAASEAVKKVEMVVHLSPPTPHRSLATTSSAQAEYGPFVPPSPPGGGTTAPPGGETPTPPAGGTTTPPAGGTTAPSGGGTTAPSGGGTTAPSGGGTTAPPGGGTTTPPGGGTTAPGGTFVPPKSNNPAQNPSTGQPSAGSATATSPTLPFTGLALWLPLVLGIGLIAFGLALRSAGRRRDSDA